MNFLRAVGTYGYELRARRSLHWSTFRLRAARSLSSGAGFIRRTVNEVRRTLTSSLGFARNCWHGRERPPGVRADGVQRALSNLERWGIAAFGASSAFLKAIEAAMTGDICSLCQAGLAGLATTLVLAAPPARSARIYSAYYILAFLLLRYDPLAWPPQLVQEGGFLLYVAALLSQSLRPGRWPGLPVVFFILLHFAVESYYFPQSDIDTLHRSFTLTWAAGFALFLELTLYFLTLQYLALQAERSRADRELDLARRVHQRLFPAFHENERFRLFARRLPENRTDGDLYDVIRLREGDAGVFLADVSGHGISSAMMGAALKISLGQAPYQVRKDPQALMNYLDRALARDFDSHHASAIYVMFQFAAGRVQIANAGHPALLYAPAGGAFTEIVTQGAILGFELQNPVAPIVERPLFSGDRFLLYTDGLIEYESPTSGPGARLLDMPGLLRGLETLNGAALIDAVLERVQAQPDFGAFADDVTLALIEIR